MTPVIRALLIVTTAVFLVQFIPFVGTTLTGWCSLTANEVFARGQVWRLVTYMFFHATFDFLHIVFNMLGLWMFGRELEELWGTKKFLLFYLGCGLGAGLFSAFYLIVPFMRGIEIIGASGAVLGIMTAFAFYYPHREVLLFFVVPVRIWLVVAGYAVISLLFAFQAGNPVAHCVHLGGIAVALGYLKGWPRVDNWLQGESLKQREKEMRARARENIGREKFYQDKVDPVLAKISQSGVESLSREERIILKKAGKNNKERLKREKVIPFDAFKGKK